MVKYLLSIVVPAYNESENLVQTCDDIISAIPINYTYEIVVIDDGSTDSTVEIMHKINSKNKKIKLIALSRNFGKEIATTAGINSTKGDVTLILDADGQHPPELIPEFLAKWEAGSKVVIGVRESNVKEGFVKKYGSKIFYVLLNKIAGVKMVPSSTDFRLIDKEVSEAFKTMKESNRITRGLIDWLGYSPVYLTFHAKERIHGEAGYSTKKLIKLALNSVVSLSLLPLYISSYTGIFISTLSAIIGTVVLIENYILSDPLGWDITGSASLGILIVFLVGVLLMSQGLIALYISRIYEESRGRPLYAINKSRSLL
jgi:dolichol-phosphate mannosyltransferase